MANIVISELRPAGSELFMDSESYMHDITDNELHATKGGITPLIYITIGIYIGYELAQ
ncbi:hypothetical protein [Nostoc sp.]|uniref:hypothetical protein n=1 Tax=Nostoc sp. TaxID=1180 RepID=UPI002FFA5394